MNLLACALLAFTSTGDVLPQPDVWQVARQSGRSGRVLFAPDPILLQVAEDPDFTPDWEETVTRDEKGRMSHRLLRNGWAYTEYESATDQAVLLEGNGFHSIFVNGERFVGDYYSRGYLRIPVPLKAGANKLLVRALRGGGFSLQFSPAEGPVSISPRDPIFPDLRRDELLNSFGALILLNHTSEVQSNAVLTVGDGEVFEQIHVLIEPIIPYGLVKPPLPLRQLRQPTDLDLNEDGNYVLPITLTAGEWKQTFERVLRVRDAGALYNVTRLSEIDGSVQYYAVRPPLEFDPSRAYALYLTLHGAGVEGTGQAAAYASKQDGFIVAPTNRRPFGFDWQEWGRLDALEALDHFLQDHPIDPARIYLTGHSMGGHGTWYLGALYPSRFAAIAPSAGWISFGTYGRRSRSDASSQLDAFTAAGMENDTLGLLRNYANLPIYILHGEKDDNVPATESHRMVAELEPFHRDFVYHEQPGAGHWWGSDCVDWPPLFDFLRSHANPFVPSRIEFVTPNPAISSTYAWIQILSQNSSMEHSSIEGNADPRRGTVKLTTTNIERLELDLGKVLTQPEATLSIDGTELTVSTEEPTRLERDPEDIWRATEEFSRWPKSAHRNGPFKLAFDQQMVWVYGTAGTEEENAALLAKVRYDSQVWWYRGNGHVSVIADRDFSPETYQGRNVILYGNADTNTAFAQLLEGCPIRVIRDGIHLGDSLYEGDLAILFVFPRQGSGKNLIGVIGATSVQATRQAFQARYFVSGVGVPDYVVYGRETLSAGFDGVLQAGYFSNEWKLADQLGGE